MLFRSGVVIVVENFMQGYGCCQSVVAAFADLYGLDDEYLCDELFF